MPLFSHKHLFATASVTLLLLASSCFVAGDTITSTVIANGGPDESEVEDSQTNTFFPLAAMTTHVGTSGTVTHSSVNASFTSEDLFQVNVNNDWDASGAPTGGTMGFGDHFEYEFVAEGTQIMVTTSNFIEQPLFAGGNTLGANSFRWKINDLTIPNGFVVIDFDANGSQSLPLTVGHDYLLRLTDQSSVAGGTFGFGLLHSATFDVSVPALFANGDFNEDGTVDAADYTVWRDNLNGGSPLPNDNGLGTPIGSAHYDLWVDNFGPSASTSVAIPEPASSLITIVAMMGGCVFSSRVRCVGGVAREWLSVPQCWRYPPAEPGAN